MITLLPGIRVLFNSGLAPRVFENLSQSIHKLL